MTSSKALSTLLTYFPRLVWLVGVITVLYGFWAWFVMGRGVGLLIAAAVIIAGPVEDVLSRKPLFGFSDQSWIAFVDQLTSLLFLLLLIWAVSLAL